MVAQRRNLKMVAQRRMSSKISSVQLVNFMFLYQKEESMSFHNICTLVLRQRLLDTNSRLPGQMKCLVMPALVAALGLLLGSVVNVSSFYVSRVVSITGEIAACTVTL